MDPNPLPPSPIQPPSPAVVPGEAGTKEGTPPPPSPAKPKNRLLISLVILIVLLCLGTAGFLAYKYVQLKQQAAITTYETCAKAPGSRLQASYPSVCVTRDGRRFPQPLTDEEKRNLLPPDETANWKTYTTSRNFSFRYPNNYEVVERVPGFYAITDPQNSKIPQAGITIETRLQNPYNNYQVADEYFHDNFLISDDHFIQDQTDKSASQVVWTSFLGTGKNDTQKGFNFLIGTKQYKTGVIVVETLASSAESNYFDQILSTFKFTQ